MSAERMRHNAYDVIVDYFRHQDVLKPPMPKSEWSLVRRREFGEPVITFVLVHDASWQQLELPFRLTEREAMVREPAAVFAELSECVQDGVDRIWSRWLAL